MKLLHCVKRFLDSDDGASGFEQVVMVGCTVILCLSIQIHAHRHPEMRGPSDIGDKPWQAASRN
jgi:hypothetical protein